jgi:hypothetical protein
MDIDWLKRLARLYLPIYQYESDTMKIAYAGYSSIKKHYFVRSLLVKSNHHTFLGRRLFWQIPDLINSYNLDMVVSEISPYVLSHFQKFNGYIVPEWVRMKINIDRPISEICKGSASDFSDIRRRIRKYNLTYEMLTGEESFNYFKDKFYQPYISRRHREEAWFEDLDLMWESSPAPLLIAIKEDGVIAGEVLIRKSGESLCLLVLGLLDGEVEYRRHGVIGALYYFGLVEGQKMGCRYLDVGCTRPFLTDGLTKYKLGLGAQFVSSLSSTDTYLWIGVNEHSIVAGEFMKSNPVIYINNDFSLAKSGT